ncbi:carboxypeptidase-like regulatory domain-containing protein [Niastella sp. OAS944]|uniref:carboxypeptidase-like regulatory domain-containing protein n=1 Tax=Niastella sp. OAS944 TaxID=2664089 RepID=UPI00347B5A25|nr:adenylate cyclase class IV [Chitinophagaceae bacterium OAS944]
MSRSVHIKVPKPCHENWNNMTPDEQGRFCGSCQKVVVDFTAMSDQQLLDHLSKTAGQHACGRFSSHQLNRNIKAMEKKRRISWAYVWNLLLATFLVTESYAQEKPQISKKPDVQLPSLSPTVGTFAVKEPDTMPTKEIRGTIKDQDTYEPIANATITVKGTAIGTVTDSLGRFKIMVNDKSPITLEIMGLGYEPQTVVMNKKKNWQNVKVTMKGNEAIVVGLMVCTPEEN